jgi:hypothetical protein
MPADPFEDLVVDRVDRPDGRYVLYYRWPPADVADTAAHSALSEAEEAPDADALDV